MALVVKKTISVSNPRPQEILTQSLVLIYQQGSLKTYRHMNTKKSVHLAALVNEFSQIFKFRVKLFLTEMKVPQLGNC